MRLKVVLDEDAVMPTKAHDNDAGFDLYSREDKEIPPHNAPYWQNNSAVFDTGVHIEIPEGYTLFLKSKSGLNVKHHLTSDGVIDAGYTGPIVVKLYNHGTEPYYVHKGDKISQGVFLPIPSVELYESDSLEESERGANGFGSSGR